MCEDWQCAVLEVASPYPQLIDRFDGECNHRASFPDLEFVVPGLPKPLKLHRSSLAPISQLVHDALVRQSRSWLVWPFDTTAADRAALVKVLRFCYGETMRVAPHEVCPVATAVCRLQLKHAPSVLKQLADFAMELAKSEGRAKPVL